MRKTNSYVQLDSAVIEQARQMDLLSYVIQDSEPKKAEYADKHRNY